MSNSLNSKKKSSTYKIPGEVFTDLAARNAGIYVLLMLAVFPLFATDMYYNVLNDKFYFFFYSTLAMSVLNLMVLGIGFAGGTLRKQKDGTKPLAKYFRLKTEDWFLLGFVAVAGISTLFSEWPYEAFWGNVGRMQGMFFFLIILVSWFMVTRFYRYRPFHMYLFLIVGAILCLWGVTDYFGMDIFGWRADANDYWNMLVFTSSIGNVNTFTAVAALYFGIAAVMSLEKKNRWFFLLIFFVSSMALTAGTSDNALLAVCGVFGLLPFYTAGDRNRIPGFVLLFGVFALALAVIGLASSLWTATPLQTEWNWGVLLKLSNNYYKKLFVIAAVLAAAAAGLFVLGKKTCAFSGGNYRPGTVRTVWGCVCVLVLLFAAYCFYDANTSGRLTFLQPFYGYLVFDDRWGTNRGYAWRATFDFFGKFNIFHKLFGSGPETFAIFMAENYYYEMIEFMDCIFDSPHSEPLQYLFTTGILGFICHYGLMVTAFLKGFKKEGHAAAFAFAAAAYICASLINISVPISTPLLFLAAAFSVTVGNNEQKAENT